MGRRAHEPRGRRLGRGYPTRRAAGVVVRYARREQIRDARAILGQLLLQIKLQEETEKEAICEPGHRMGHRICSQTYLSMHCGKVKLS